MMRIGAIVQARFSSQRLPGKVVRPLCGKPMIVHLVDRLRRCASLDLIAVATSTDPLDDAVAKICAAHEIACYRGALDDVLGRFLAASRHFALDGVVRLSGDSPLLAPTLVDEAVALFRGDDWDLVSNVQQRSFPKGQSVEVIAVDALARAAAAAETEAEREHVTPYLYAHPDRFRIRNIAASVPRPTLQLSVDTAEDFSRIEAIIRAAGPRADRMGLAEVIALADMLASARRS